MSTTSTAIYSNPLFATYSVYARNASISSYRGNRPTKPQIQTDRQDQLQYTAPLATTQCNDTDV